MFLSESVENAQKPLAFGAQETQGLLCVSMLPLLLSFFSLISPYFFLLSLSCRQSTLTKFSLPPAWRGGENLGEVQTQHRGAAATKEKLSEDLVVEAVIVLGKIYSINWLTGLLTIAEAS